MKAFVMMEVLGTLVILGIALTAFLKSASLSMSSLQLFFAKSQPLFFPLVMLCAYNTKTD